MRCVVATPDHWHAGATVLACQAGKDVYVEKPLSYSVLEGRAMVDAARRYKRLVQAGTQHRSAPHFMEAAEIVRSGQLGQVRFVRVWNYVTVRRWAGSPSRIRASAGPRLGHVPGTGAQVALQRAALESDLPSVQRLRGRHDHGLRHASFRHRARDHGRGPAEDHLGQRRAVRPPTWATFPTSFR